MDLTHRFPAAPSARPRGPRGVAAIRLRPSRRLAAGLLLLAASLALALAAAMSASAWVEAEASRRAAALALPEARVRLLVTARDLAAGTQLAPDMAQVVDWPKTALAPGARPIDPAGLAGKRLAVALPAGVPLLAAHVTANVTAGAGSSLSARLGPGMRAVGLPLDPAAGLGGFLAPGDRVDLHYATRLADGRTVSGTALTNLRVLGLDQQLDVPAEGEAEATLPSTITLEVPAADVEAVALLAEQATISLSLRARGDAGGDPAPLSTAGLADRLAPLVQATARAAEAAAPAAGPAPPRAGSRPSDVRVQVVRGHSVRSAAAADVPTVPPAEGEGAP